MLANSLHLQSLASPGHGLSNIVASKSGLVPASFWLWQQGGMMRRPVTGNRNRSILPFCCETVRCKKAKSDGFIEMTSVCSQYEI
jgi:hypothetical protein